MWYGTGKMTESGEVLWIPVPAGVADTDILLQHLLNGDHYTGEDMRLALRSAQLDNHDTRIMIDILRVELDSNHARSRERDSKRMPPSDRARFRMNPINGVLAATVILRLPCGGCRLFPMHR